VIARNKPLVPNSPKLTSTSILAKKLARHFAKYGPSKILTMYNVHKEVHFVWVTVKKLHIKISEKM
jgi:hypothetical protein